MAEPALKRAAPKPWKKEHLLCRITCVNGKVDRHTLYHLTKMTDKSVWDKEIPVPGRLIEYVDQGVRDGKSLLSFGPSKITH